MNVYKTPGLLKRLYPNLIWKVPTSKKEIFLTFDDGPVVGVTDLVLDILREYHATATFFCVGANVEKQPELTRRIVADGHTLGNHTFNHLNGWKTDLQYYLDNVAKCNEAFTRAKVEPSKFYNKAIIRPPYGRIGWRQLRELKKDNSIVMWDVLSCDYDKRDTAEYSLMKICRAIEPGSIVVFHDSIKAKDKMLQMLEPFLEYSKSEGYQVKAFGNHVD